MEIKDYCRNVDMELNVWKARLYDVINRMDHLPTERKERMFQEVNGLHILMSDLEERIEGLRTACPTEWSPERDEIRGKFAEINTRYNDTAGVAFDYDIGG